MKIRNQVDFASGLVFIAIALFFAGLSTHYQLGTASQMGPGYFPFWLSVILAILGLFLALNSLSLNVSAEQLEGWPIKALFLIIGSVVLFGVLLSSMGLLVAVAALIVASSWASSEFRWGATALNLVVLTVICVVLFVYGLKLPLQVLPKFIGG